MKKVFALVSLLSVFLLGMNLCLGQSKDFFKDRKFLLNEEGTNYFKLTVLNQAWVRNLEYNPGSTIFGVSKENGTDIGIRRFRIQFFGQLTDKVFFYSQIGQNNFNNISDRKQGFFIHDALGEYALDQSKLSVGAGLNGWSGLSRFSSPSVGTILGIDVPLFLQTTNDVTDQFLRKLSVYAKGKLGKLDYRLALAQPMAIQKSANFNSANTIGQTANFSTDPPNLQWNGYFQYQFKDQETNLTSYTIGTYLGKKKIFNIGAGFIFQKDAMWHRESVNSDIVYDDMKHFAVDLFYDYPLGNKGEAVSFYCNYTNYDFGKNNIRNLGVMNPSNGNSNPDILNGGGNAFPMYGTGGTLYGQVGYKFKDNLIGNTTLMPYASIQHSDYNGLNATVNFYDIGVNWLLSNHVSKFTVSYQNRPVFNTSRDLIDNKGAVIAQYQVFFN